MPSKSLGLFPASLSTDPLFCLEFVEITNKIETAGELKAREREGVAVGKVDCSQSPIFPCDHRDRARLTINTLPQVRLGTTENQDGRH